MARARRFTRFVRPPARTKMWIGSGVGATALTASTTTLVSSLSAGALALRPFTILRTRMLLQYVTDQITALETPFGSYGEIVVTDAATAIGVTAIPNPSGITGNPEADWYVWQAVASRFGFITAAGFNNTATQYIIDSKAMRKVGPDDDAVSMFHQDAAFGATLVTNGRQLIQLH